MKILVCVKQVPDTNEVKIDPVKGTLIRDGVPSILNPDDANALEAALQLKDKDESVEIAVITATGNLYVERVPCNGGRRGLSAERPCLRRRRYLRNLHHHRSRHQESRRRGCDLCRPPGH